MLSCNSLGISLVCWCSVSPFWFLWSVFYLRGLAGCSYSSGKFLSLFWSLHDHCLVLFLSCLLHLVVCHWRMLILSIFPPEPAQLIQKRWSGHLPLWRLHPTTSCQRRLGHKPRDSLTAEGVSFKCFWSWLCWGRWKEMRCWIWGWQVLLVACRRFRDNSHSPLPFPFLSHAFLKILAVWATMVLFKAVQIWLWF